MVEEEYEEQDDLKADHDRPDGEITAGDLEEALRPEEEQPQDRCACDQNDPDRDQHPGATHLPESILRSCATVHGFRIRSTTHTWAPLGRGRLLLSAVDPDPPYRFSFEERTSTTLVTSEVSTSGSEGSMTRRAGALTSDRVESRPCQTSKMSWTEKREREQAQRAAAEAFAVLDEVVDYHLQVHARRVSPDPARYGTALVVERLLTICGRDPDNIVAVCSAWFDAREAERTDDDDPRAFVVSVVQESIGFVGVGNLFGYIPEGAPSYAPALVAEGRARGWRT